MVLIVGDGEVTSGVILNRPSIANVGDLFDKSKVCCLQMFCLQSISTTHPERLALQITSNHVMRVDASEGSCVRRHLHLLLSPLHLILLADVEGTVERCLRVQKPEFKTSGRAG